MNFSKKKHEYLYVVSKKISLILSLILLIFMSSCTNDDMIQEETETPETSQEKVLSIEEINDQIQQSLEESGSFNWKDTSDYLLWSATFHGGNILTIGYGDSSFRHNRKKVVKKYSFMMMKHSIL